MVLDRSTRLTPYWRDQDVLWETLRRILPPTGLSRVITEHRYARMMDPTQPGNSHHQPAAGETVLALTDLGLLSTTDPAPLIAAWCRWARYWKEHHARPVVLFPGLMPRVPAMLAQQFTIVPWQQLRLASDGADDQACIEELMALLAPFARVEPGLLRELRMQCHPDAALEAKCWQHPRVASPHSEAATLSRANPQAAQAAFAARAQRLRQDAIDIASRWHATLSPEVLAAELVALEPGNRSLIDAATLKRARATLIALSATVTEGDGRDSAWQGAVRNWWSQMADQLPQAVLDDAEVGLALQRMDRVLHQHDPDYEPAYVPDPRVTAPTESDVVSEVDLLQEDAAVVLRPLDSTAHPHASPIGRLALRGKRLRVGRVPRFWRSTPPAWAWQWGWDEFETPWVTVAFRRLENTLCTARPGDDANDCVLQTLRWMSPGEFTMGSPEDEPGRLDDEGPRHRVALTRGFWLFDTPVTQGLWQLVMGENPSRFPSPERPVERVSWDDCQAFMDRLNDAVPDMALTLPTEAQWEYACRAGTQTALWSGPIELLGENNAPALDSVAWYGGNSGVGFELGEVGLRSESDPWLDPAEWPNKQYAFERAGSRVVRERGANPWGLFDTLGNVWEWCADYGGDAYTQAPAIDPTGPSAGVARVLRGGSWALRARHVRCASRAAYDPSLRSAYLGFRCARVQPGAEPSSKPVPVKARRPERTAERSRRRAGATATAYERLDLRRKHQFDLANAGALRLHSSEADLTLRSIRRPEWASAFGRDRFGLWAEFTLLGNRGAAQLVVDAPLHELAARPHVTQRMRWIPPGQFLMGSPADEPGRFDDELQHLVGITQGYWLFDTPVTQALWSVVVGKNPARFTSPTRPVDSVSWEDCQDFLERMNDATELALRLPTEAQWEYACRAGTRGAIYTGPMEVLGENNAPALDAIAWYGGNSGVDFDLKRGESARHWPHRQHEFKQAGTRVVRLKQANAWGLHDMLGNVWEWCGDWNGAYSDGPAQDPEGPSAGDARVFRGGSWADRARDVRCASRLAVDPSSRFDNLGFRCARVQI
ncbi:MAG: formylglycine-generating enzyme family protein [Pseudomonadota bacterium]